MRRTLPSPRGRRIQNRASIVGAASLALCFLILFSIASPEPSIPPAALLEPCNNMRLSHLKTFHSFLHSYCLVDLTPRMSHPSISVIVTAHNSVDDTYRALISLAHQISSLSFEVVLVDDASTDDTPVLMSRVLGVRTHRFESKQRYALANNFAVFNLSSPAASYLWFLNNDLEMANDQVLSSLVSLIAPNPKVGAVGGKLILLSGKLQEAGSFIWRDSYTVGLGRDDSPRDPAYTFVRDVDYCSAACLLVRRSVFLQLGGFDATSFPMYFEDTDLQMRIRYTANLSVLFQPLAEINHREHGSSSRRRVTPLINAARVIFQKRWAEELAQYHYAHLPANSFCARNRRPGLRILLIDSSIMDHTYGADFTRTQAVLSAIAASGHMLTVFPYVNKRRSASVTDFEQMGIEFCCFDSVSSSSPSIPLDISSPILSAAFARFLKVRAGQFDAVIVSHASVFEVVLPVLTLEVPHMYIIFNAETFWWKWFYKKVELEAGQEATYWAAEEQRRRLALFQACRQAWLLSAADVALVKSLPMQARVWLKEPQIPLSVWLIEHGVPMMPYPSSQPLVLRRAVGFAGVFRNPQDSDAEALIWFIDNVWRGLAGAHAGLTLTIGGATPPRELLAVIAGHSGASLTSHSPDAEFYAGMRVFVLPHQYGANLQNKLVEAMSAGVPCVLMRQWAAPLGLEEHKSGVLLADNARDMLAAISRLLTEDELWNDLSRAAYNSVLMRTNMTVFQESIAQSLADIPRKVCLDRS